MIGYLPNFQYDIQTLITQTHGSFLPISTSFASRKIVVALDVTEEYAYSYRNSSELLDRYIIWLVHFHNIYFFYYLMRELYRVDRLICHT